jgi:hypothetical protein
MGPHTLPHCTAHCHCADNDHTKNRYPLSVIRPGRARARAVAPVAPRREAAADVTYARTANIHRAARDVRRSRERERSSASQSKCMADGRHPSSSSLPLLPTQGLSCSHYARHLNSSRGIPRAVPPGESRSTAPDSAPPDPVPAPDPVCAASPWSRPRECGTQWRTQRGGRVGTATGMGPRPPARFAWKPWRRRTRAAAGASAR